MLPMAIKLHSVIFNKQMYVAILALAVAMLTCVWLFHDHFFILALHFQCSEPVFSIRFLLVLWNDSIASIYSQIHPFVGVSICTAHYIVFKMVRM